MTKCLLDEFQGHALFIHQLACGMSEAMWREFPLHAQFFKGFGYYALQRGAIKARK